MKMIAELHLQLVRPGSTRKSRVEISIGEPQPDGEDWYCAVRINGLGKKLDLKIFGVDSWQALNLALRLVETLLKHEVREGAALFYLGQKTSVGKLFARRVGR